MEPGSLSRELCWQLVLEELQVHGTTRLPKTKVEMLLLFIHYSDYVWGVFIFKHLYFTYCIRTTITFSSSW